MCILIILFLQFVLWMTWAGGKETKVNSVFQLRLALFYTNLSIHSYILFFTQPSIYSNNIYCGSQWLLWKLECKLHGSRTFLLTISVLSVSFRVQHHTNICSVNECQVKAVRLCARYWEYKENIDPGSCTAEACIQQEPL